MYSPNAPLCLLRVVLEMTKNVVADSEICFLSDLLDGAGKVISGTKRLALHVMNEVAGNLLVLEAVHDGIKG